MRRIKACLSSFVEDEAHSKNRILTPHYAATLQRCEVEKTVLAVQDTTALNYSRHPATEK
ncbi:hypothetical protein JW964_17300 [candidate division KSB1 bacterium]|nr:hypothetical protein [candidate division KSB1 bacterium]